ncbi:endonuclease/exonuclease/phosphatase family protein [Sesbania bispinosa]|nr:endonuclease/exonuclease/phosphatase family protein [Sesbania bispinosa]
MDATENAACGGSWLDGAVTWLLQQLEILVKIRTLIGSSDSSNGWSAMRQRGLMFSAETGLHAVGVGFCYPAVM